MLNYWMGKLREGFLFGREITLVSNSSMCTKSSAEKRDLSMKIHFVLKRGGSNTSFRLELQDGEVQLLILQVFFGCTV